jgi:predicted aspartyl protease
MCGDATRVRQFLFRAAENQNVLRPDPESSYMRTGTLAALAATILLVSPAERVGAQTVAQATVPLIVEGNRPFIELTFRKPDGSVRKARFLIDTGGGGFLITEPLAHDLGLTWGPEIHEEGSKFAVVVSAPEVSVGDFRLDLNPKRTLVLIGASSSLPSTAPGHADGTIPGHVLAQYDIVFDYPGAMFTIARPSTLTHRGMELQMPVSKRSGFPRTEVVVDDTTYGLMIDTGASNTMVSEVALKAWGGSHPDWPRYPGAYGDAAMLGGQALETLFLPGAEWGSIHLEKFGVVSQHAGVFERYMSGMMAAPIIGSLAGNVLKSYRIELDYPDQRLYVSESGK